MSNARWRNARKSCRFGPPRALRLCFGVRKSTATPTTKCGTQHVRRSPAGTDMLSRSSKSCRVLAVSGCLRPARRNRTGCRDTSATSYDARCAACARMARACCIALWFGSPRLASALHQNEFWGTITCFWSQISTHNTCLPSPRLVSVSSCRAQTRQRLLWAG